MPLAAGCPRCATPVASTGGGDTWSCPEHGVVRPLWRPEKPSYDDFVDHLAIAGPFPTYLPWPLGPGWQVSDFAVVQGTGPVATLTVVTGASDLDGSVDVVVVAEEAGVGLGGRAARTFDADPGPEVGEGPPMTRARVGSKQVPLWPVSRWTPQGDLDGPGNDPGHDPNHHAAVGMGADESADDLGPWDQAALVGEADGRWLWLILRPASAILMLRHDWILRDVSRLGPALVELPFGGSARPW